MANFGGSDSINNCDTPTTVCPIITKYIEFGCTENNFKYIPAAVPKHPNSPATLNPYGLFIFVF